MKNIFTILAVFCFIGSAHAYYLRTGTYQLSGGNSQWGSSYQGEVIIAPQGENYKVTWFIGSQQCQVGVGILQDDVLSVAFNDITKNFWGIASYRVKFGGELEGKWTSFDGQTQKPEYLVWKSYSTY